MLRRLLGMASALLLVTLLLLGSGLAGARNLVIYTSLEEDEAALYLGQLKKDLPDLRFEWIRLSTGELAARVEAEKDNPRADVLFGVFNDYLSGMAAKGLIEPYRPQGVERIPERYRDPQNYWTGITILVIAFGVNERELRRIGGAVPETWDDLLHPRFRGQVVMPNPTTSGTAYLVVSSRLMQLGEEKGWNYLKELDKNIAQYTRSGGAPGRLAAQGEYAVGISFAFPMLQLKAQGYPIQVIIPKDGAGWTIEANALVRGARNPDLARRFLDWAISPSAMRSYATLRLAVTDPTVDPASGLPRLDPALLAQMDFLWAAENRDRLVRRWLELFGR